MSKDKLEPPYRPADAGPKDKFIYETPDGGNTVYARKLGTDLSERKMVFQNPEMKKKFQAGSLGMYIRPNALAFTAMLSAYESGDPWREELLEYLQANCEYLEKRVESIPGISMSPVEATYLAWLDVSELKLNDAFGFFEAAGLGFSDGNQFEGPGYMRLNFACARETLIEACDRLEKAVLGHLEAQ